MLHNDDWDKKTKGSNIQVSLTGNSRNNVLLTTAIVKCYAKNGTTFLMRALIDQGSQATIITEHGAQLLKAERKRLSLPIKAVGDIVTGKIQ